MQQLQVDPMDDFPRRDESEHFQNKKRKLGPTNDNGNDNSTSSSSKLLLLKPSLALYHTEGITTSPYDVQKKSEEILYLPLTDTLFVNPHMYDEISVSRGVYFLADETGVYDKTVEGITFNFLKYNATTGKMAIVRSFLATSTEVADDIGTMLSST